MRRFTSVFSSKRDKGDSSTSSHPSHSTTNLSKKTVKRANTFHSPVSSSTSSSPHLSRGSDIAHSSASSTGSASLQTPDDLPLSLDRTPTKAKSWISWLGKKPSVIKVRQPQTQEINRDWRPSCPPPLLRQPPPGIRSPPPVHDSEQSSSEDDDDDSFLSGHPVEVDPTFPSSAVPISRKYLHSLIQNALVYHLSLSPFVQLDSQTCPLYPRSCNSPRSLSHQESLRSSMLKAHLLRRLLDPADAFTPAEQDAILPFSLRSPPLPLLPGSFSDSVDEVALPKSAHVVGYSEGLRRWINRPCFEHRFAVWIRTDDGITQCQVTGTRFAVADLEFSETLEAMADFSQHLYQQLPLPSQAVELSSHAVIPLPQPLPVPEQEPEPEPEMLSPSSEVPPPSPSSSSSHTSQPGRVAPYLATPSPLRNQHAVLKSTSPGSSSASVQPSSSAPAKRGVRFAEDGKEDKIPIGYVMRIKKQREAKAKFLREQQERRQFEEEKIRIEDERRKREQERIEWEKERQAWEKEKRAIEEERRKRLYAEELAAARMRRENQRHGGSSRAISSSSSYTSLRGDGNGFERIRHDSMKQLRPSHDHLYVQPSPARLQGSTSSPSRRSSFVGQPAIPSPMQFGQLPLPIPGPGSRPSSLYSSSSEDVGMSTKRYTMASTSNYHNVNMWSASNASLLPPAGFDMPLLPPTAPFMLHQYHPRQPLQPLLSPSPSKHSFSRSSDRISRPSTYDSSLSNRSSSSSPHRQVNHQRRSSGDHQPSPMRPQQQRGRAIEPASSNRLSTASSRSNVKVGYTAPNIQRGVPTRRQTSYS
ncbi:uncharacterized protein BT62DRAFT_1002654 [Guyanagaster necrorhizus]|uniref:Uncharacterized protein n=1 Tax=Guyanagaster necrorhizus TaxID=856835 RepID=A0A9P7W0H6_9AGAR|nr:uncharacterized protein BT62DRAFT_1002654 [Guyanagaster necrorhizus MCA 3950]KAG7449111.1 hypothetical protein BT62DRAFT_1002654 [Guyanagaster necrorhizus MCA 3950]